MASPIVGTAGDDTLQDTPGNDILNGNEKSGIQSGADGDDVLNGWTGIDTLEGGAGNDGVLNLPGFLKVIVLDNLSIADLSADDFLL